jgi:2-dehydropantoate 2-reductase
MRVAVFAAGAVGGYFGGRLAQAGEEIAFIARGDHLRTIRERGLRVDSVAGDFVVHPADVTDDPRQVGPVECVLLAVKTWQLPQALEQIGPLVGEETFLVPLLNGVEAPDVLSKAFGEDHVLGGLCRILARVAGPGHIQHTGVDPTIHFGELDGSRTERTERLLAAFDRASGVRARVPDDINVALWEKLLSVASIGGVGAVTRAPVGVNRSVEQTRALLEAAMGEIGAVARARGVPLPADAVERALAFMDTLPDHGKTSLHQDIADGRRSELDAWNGAVVRLGREARVDTPVHAFLYAALLPQELRARGETGFAEPPAG